MENNSKSTVKDKTEKYLENYPDVFADLANVFVFGGSDIKPEDLSTGPTGAIYKSEEGNLRENIRDILKYVQKRGVYLAMIGIENQSTVDKDMVIRIMGYDYTSYKGQIDAGKARYPVITTVLYFGETPWNGATTLKELLRKAAGDDKEILKYIDKISDYKINVVDVPRLPQETIDKLTSDFKSVAEFFVHRKDENYVQSTRKLKHADAVLELLRVFTKDERYKSIEMEIAKEAGKGADVSMCEVLDRAENRGIAKGELLNLIKLIIRKIEKGKEFNIIADELEEDLVTIKKIYEIAVNKAPEYNVEEIYKEYKKCMSV